MKYYFIVTIHEQVDGNHALYEEYINGVKAIVESYGGKYLVRTNDIEYWSDNWFPNRVVIVAFNNEDDLRKCFSSKEYQNIAYKRTTSVDSRVIIVKGETYADMSNSLSN